jgi:hypothetical protein
VVLGKVAEMKVEYFAPKEDIVLFNDSPSELYILVTGSAVSISFHSSCAYPKLSCDMCHYLMPNCHFNVIYTTINITYCTL